jgi:hypothetical protein
MPKIIQLTEMTKLKPNGDVLDKYLLALREDGAVLIFDRVDFQWTLMDISFHESCD